VRPQRQRPGPPAAPPLALPGIIGKDLYRAPQISSFQFLPKGIDISSQRANWSWLATNGTIRASPVEFGVVQATAGTGYFRPQFKHNWTDLETSKLVRGAYHFLTTSHVAAPDPNDPAKRVYMVQRDRDRVIAHAEAQAANYIRTVGSLKGALPPFLDIEWQVLERDAEGKPTVTLNVGRHSANTLLTARIWIDRIRAEYHRDPIIYTATSYWLELGNPTELSHLRLWIAAYRDKADAGPVLPGGWRDWTFKQFAGDTLEMAGIFNGEPTNNPFDRKHRGKADLNVFNGIGRELYQLGDQPLRWPDPLTPVF
jgi:lysozyme